MAQDFRKKSSNARKEPDRSASVSVPKKDGSLKQDKTRYTYTLEEYTMLLKVREELKQEEDLRDNNAERFTALAAEVGAHREMATQRYLTSCRIQQLKEDIQFQKRELERGIRRGKEEVDSSFVNLISDRADVTARAHQIRAALVQLFQRKESLDASRKMFDTQRDYLRKTLVAGEMLRWRLVDQLKGVYPIRPGNDGIYLIAGIALPNSDFTGCDEEEIAAALGSVAHVLTLVSRWFAVPLRYQILLMASRSVIIDDIAQQSSPRFPLFSRGVDRTRFEYGVFLLNKNLQQLCQRLNISMGDLRHTLPNLLLLLNRVMATPPPAPLLRASASLEFVDPRGSPQEAVGSARPRFLSSTPIATQPSAPAPYSRSPSSTSIRLIPASSSPASAMYSSVPPSNTSMGFAKRSMGNIQPNLPPSMPPYSGGTPPSAGVVPSGPTVVFPGSSRPQGTTPPAIGSKLSTSPANHLLLK